MTGSAASQRLRPSLLDRLTDQNPERQVESVRDRTVDDTELHELVRRDLTWLFNTTHMASSRDFSEHPEVARSVLNFGIPDLTGRMLSSIDMQQLESCVLLALQHFEPRLVPDSIRVSARAGNDSFGTTALIFDIEGELWAEPLPLMLYLDRRRYRVWPRRD